MNRTSDEMDGMKSDSRGGHSYCLVGLKYKPLLHVNLDSFVSVKDIMLVEITKL